MSNVGKAPCILKVGGSNGDWSDTRYVDLTYDK